MFPSQTGIKAREHTEHFQTSKKSSYFPMDGIILIILYILFWLMQSSLFIVSQLTFQNYMFLKQNRSLNLKHVNISFFAKILINGKKKIKFPWFHNAP